MDNEKISECVIKLTTIIENQQKTLSDHESRLRTVESLSGKKWDKVLSALITVSITIVLNIVFRNLI